MTVQPPSKKMPTEALDRQLLELLQERIKLIGTADVDAGEFAALGKLAASIASEFGLPPDPLTSWLRHAHSICLAQVPTKASIAFLGPIYSYSYLAAVKYFGLGANLVPVRSIAAAFDAVRRGESKFAVVPIENSTDGRVVDTLGRFASSPVKICGEVLLPIHHCLLGMCPRAEVKEVHSKPQALSQCRHWLAERLPDVKQVEVASTATAAATAAEQSGVAAIASREAGVHHGLNVIDENIEDNQQNVTRFSVIGNAENEATGNDKTSLMFQLQHEPGALANAMVAFQASQVNLTWIESFPLPNCPNEYLFFVELEGHRDSETVSAALTALEKHTRHLDVLGSFPKG